MNKDVFDAFDTFLDTLTRSNGPFDMKIKIFSPNGPCCPHDGHLASDGGEARPCRTALGRAVSRGLAALPQGHGPDLMRRSSCSYQSGRGGRAVSIHQVAPASS